MKSYLTKDIRNVGIVGHGGTGKTQLVSSLLYTAGMTPRWGKVAEAAPLPTGTMKKSRARFPFKPASPTRVAATPTTPSGSSERVKSI